MATKVRDSDSDIIEVTQESIQFHILGRTPLIPNRVSQKTARTLLLPAPKKNAVEKATTLKHEPIAEFRAAAYTTADADAPTYLTALSAWFKRAMTGVAVDLQGANKAQTGRNLWVEGERLPLYGIPQLLMAVTRSANIERTPDIRSRPILAEWATRLTVTYYTPVLNANKVSRLLAAAGMIMGVADWRQEKGSGSYGQFQIVSPHDPDYQRLIATGGREAQMQAMEAPACYDDETSEMLSWYLDEVHRRRLKGTAPAELTDTSDEGEDA